MTPQPRVWHTSRTSRIWTSPWRDGLLVVLRYSTGIPSLSQKDTTCPWWSTRPSYTYTLDVCEGSTKKINCVINCSWGRWGTNFNSRLERSTDSWCQCLKCTGRTRLTLTSLMLQTQSDRCWLLHLFLREVWHWTLRTFPIIEKIFVCYRIPFQITQLAPST